MALLYREGSLTAGDVILINQSPAVDFSHLSYKLALGDGA
jgi:hypothetical protein